jgi:hypothetical protein
VAIIDVTPQPQLPFTLPQSAYNPTLSSTSFFGYPGADIHNANGSGTTAAGLGGQYHNAGHDRLSQRALWDQFDFDNVFSTQPQARIGTGYAGPPVYQEQGQPPFRLVQDNS